MPSSLYQEFKLRVIELTGLSKDAIHIYVGLIVFFSVVVFFRNGKIDTHGFIPVFVVAMLMEIVDLYDNYRTMDSMYWGNSVHDLVNTIFWPLMIVLLVKFKHGFRRET